MLQLHTDKIAWQQVDDEIVCLDLATSKYLMINRSGTELWDLLLAGTEMEPLVGRLVEVFDIDRSAAKADVNLFINELVTRGLLKSE